SAVWVLQKDPDVDLQRCGRCGALSASRMPTAAALDAYYGNYYGAAADADHVTIDRPERLGAHVAAAASAAGVEPRILDFGGGDGTIGKLVARALIDRGATRAQLTVVDYHAEPGAPCPGVTVDCLHRLEELGARRFEVV